MRPAPRERRRKSRRLRLWKRQSTCFSGLLRRTARRKIGDAVTTCRARVRRGSNLQAIIEHFDNLARERGGQGCARASNRPDSPALIRRSHSFQSIPLTSTRPRRARSFWPAPPNSDRSRVLAGYLKRIPPKVVGEYAAPDHEYSSRRCSRFWRRRHVPCTRHEAVIASGARESGVTVHLVDDDTIAGRSSRSGEMPVKQADTAETLASRVLEVNTLFILAP